MLRRSVALLSPFNRPAIAVALVVVPWRAGRLRDALIFHRGLEYHAVRKLINDVSLDLLPRRLTRRILVAAAFPERGAPRVQFRFRNENIRTSVIEINSYAVSGL